MSLLKNLFHRGRKPGGYEPPETEALLRQALAEPAAPGEDESYRRLMAVIADDMRLRQPARASWAWIPAASITAATAVLVVTAYVAGVDHGQAIGQLDNRPQVAVNPPAAPSTGATERPAPPPRVWRPAPPAATGIPPRLNPTAPRRPAAATEFIGNITAETLEPDQRDLLALYIRQYDAGEWASAARSLQRLADSAPGSELAVTALHGAAGLLRAHADNPADALPVYQSELDALDALLPTLTDPARRTALQAQRDDAARAIQDLQAQAPTP